MRLLIPNEDFPPAVFYPHQPTPFDEIMSPVMQQAWLRDLALIDTAGKRGIRRSLRQSAHHYRQLLQLPFADDIIGVLREYTQSSLPAIKRGEALFWSCVCLPETAPAVYTQINVGWQPTFQIFAANGALGFGWYIPNYLAESAFARSLNALRPGTEITILEFQGKRHWDITLQPVRRKGQGRQVTVTVRGTENAFRMLHYAPLLAAVRRFHLGLAQVGSSVRGDNHCFDLADHLVN
ncbi:MAG TPA: hypothetical protein VHO69_11000 [Phototrophicaceae bacterium]|nr:hypothetical protein [Phototrophicaceae bacterium]